MDQQTGEWRHHRGDMRHKGRARHLELHKCVHVEKLAIIVLGCSDEVRPVATQLNVVDDVTVGSDLRAKSNTKQDSDSVTIAGIGLDPWLNTVNNWRLITKAEYKNLRQAGS